MTPEHLPTTAVRPNTLRWGPITALLLALVSLRARSDSPPDAPPQVLLPAGSSTMARTAGLPPARPAPVRRLRLHPDAATHAAEWFQEGRQVRLDLLENQDITLAIEGVESTATGGRVIRGRATSDEASQVTLTLEGRSLTGFLRLNGLGTFRLAPVGTGEVLEVSRTDPQAHAFCATVPQPVPPAESSTGLARTGAARHAGEPPPADTLPEPTVVDVMFLYTPQAVIGEGNEEGIHRRVRESVEETNHRFTNSLINVRINPVYIGLYQTFETGDLPRDAQRLVNGVDGMERVPQLRNDYKADLVCLITEWENQGIAGMAWDIPPPWGNPNGGFTVIRRPAFGRGYMVLAHELGHLLGCEHDREHAAQAGNANFYAARKPYIFGHRFVVEGVTYVDVMSYEPGIYVPFFGNPRLTFDGVLLGVPAGEARPSDGARTINEIAPYVARYRTARSRIEFAEARMVVAEQGGTATVRLIRTGDLDSSTRVSVTFDAASSAKAGQDYTRPASALVAFATNQATAELVVPILADEVAEGEESIRLGLIAALGDHGIGPGRASELVILDASTPAAYSQVEFPDGPTAVPESVPAVRVKVRFSGPVPQPQDPPVVIPYRTADGTARAGTDYQGTNGLLSLPPGNLEGEVMVPLLNGPEAGPDRNFHLIVGTRTNTIRLLDGQRRGALVGNPGRDLAPDGDLNARVRSDGKLLVWGTFSRLGGRNRTGVALLNSDGSVDDAFRPPEIWLGHRPLERIGNPSANAAIAAVEVQADGRLVLAGNFSRVNGQARSTLVRLHPDGSVDDSFGKDLRFDGAVNAIAIQPDGRLVIGGAFEHINGVRRPFIARLLPDGTVDGSFQPNGGPTSDWTVTISAVALQPEGKILMGGYFKQVDGKALLNLARLNADGTLDASFKLQSGASGPVWRIRVQPDGKIVVGGVFDTVGRRSSKRLARLNADGSNDLSFRPPNPDADVNNLVCLPDGRLLLAGNFAKVGGLDRRFVALLNPDGTVANEFDPGAGTDAFVLGPPLLADGWLYLAVLADGSLYLAGTFQRFNGLPAPHLVRLHLGDLAPRPGDVRLTAGGMAMTAHGLPGGVYGVESSADLEQWQPAGEVRLEGYDQRKEFTVPSTDPGRFFRLRSGRP